MSLPDEFTSADTSPCVRFTRRKSFVMRFQALPAPHDRRSDLAVVTWVAGDKGYKWFSATGPAMKHYADRVGADLIVLEGFGSQPYCFANKFRVRQVFEEYGYEFVLFVDADILLKPDCENFFEVVPDGHVGILDEAPFLDYWGAGALSARGRGTTRVAGAGSPAPHDPDTEERWILPDATRAQLSAGSPREAFSALLPQRRDGRTDVVLLDARASFGTDLLPSLSPTTLALVYGPVRALDR